MPTNTPPPHIFKPEWTKAFSNQRAERVPCDRREFHTRRSAYFDTTLRATQHKSRYNLARTSPNHSMTFFKPEQHHNPKPIRPKGVLYDRREYLTNSVSPFPIQTPKMYRLRQMCHPDALTPCQIGNRATQFQDFIVSPSAQI
jgi:hypothetical protein